MPQYRFACSACHKLTNRVEPVGTRQVVCACGQTAIRMMPTSQTASFEPPSSIAPENTGVSSLDYVADLAIGKSAEDGKQVVRDREAYKRSLLRDNPGLTKQDLWRTPWGEYVVAPESVRRQVRQESLDATSPETVQRLREEQDPE